MIWLDAHLSPRVAGWIRETLRQDAQALRDLGVRDAEDEEIFDRAKQANVVILTKDSYLVGMVAQRGEDYGFRHLIRSETPDAIRPDFEILLISAMVAKALQRIL